MKNKKNIRFIFLAFNLLILLTLSACSANSDVGIVTATPIASDKPPVAIITPTPTTPLTDAEILEQKVTTKLASMTLEEKVAQLFITSPTGITGVKIVTEAGNDTYDALKKYPVGGLIYFSDNIIDPDQTTLLTSNTQKYATEIEGLPIFMSIDEEGGLVARIANNANFNVTKYDSMRAIGDSNDVAQASDAGKTIGTYLQEYGFNLDFAPDADVITNPDNKVIGDRSFGSDTSVVENMALAYAQGLLTTNTLPCFKHFPDHGATLGDTHEGFAYIDKTLDELEKNELVPFQTAIDNNMPFIMVAHISVPKIIGDNTPSSLSYKMITEVLRNKMGYKGIIITDSLCMGAIKNNYDIKDAAVMAILAGDDMLMIAGNKDTMNPEDFTDAYQGVLDAVNDKTISIDIIDNAVKNILRVKYQYLNLN